MRQAHGIEVQVHQLDGSDQETTGTIGSARRANGLRYGGEEYRTDGTMDDPGQLLQGLAGRGGIR